MGHLQGAERAAAICTLLGKEKKPDPAELKQAAAAPGIQGPSLIDPTAHATSAFMKGERVTAVSGSFSIFHVSIFIKEQFKLKDSYTFNCVVQIEVRYIVPGNTSPFEIMIGALKI